MISRRLRFRADLKIPPRYAGPEDHGHRVTWLELFFDLVFVVAVGQMASRLYDNFTWTGLAGVAGLFIAMWWAWVGKVFYTTRFDTNDLWMRVITGAQMFGVATLALATSGALEDRANTFALAYVFVRLLLVIEYARVWKHVEEARDLAIRYGGGFLVAALLWLLSLWVPGEAKFWLWAVAIVLDYLTPVVFAKFAIKFPPHIHHLPERFGLFTLLVLGEVILSVVVGLDKAKLSPLGMGVALLAWLTVFCMWWGYFEGIRAADSRSAIKPALAKLFRVWMYAHLPLHFGLVVCAIVAKKAIIAPEKPFDFAIAASGTLAAILVQAVMNLISRTRPIGDLRGQLNQFLVPHNWLIGLSVLCFPLGYFGAAWMAVAWLAVIWVGHVVFAIREESVTFEKPPQPIASQL